MFEVAEYIGIIAFTKSGFFVAIRNKLDLLGILIATFSHNYPAVIVLLLLLVLIMFKFHKKESIENKLLFILSDSIGLVSFSITGALIAIESKFNLTGILSLSFITAVGGGIVRDIIINEVPFVFKTGFYGTVALLMGLLVFILNATDTISFFSLSTIFFLGVMIRIVAYYRKWRVPII